MKLYSKTIFVSCICVLLISSFVNSEPISAASIYRYAVMRFVPESPQPFTLLLVDPLAPDQPQIRELDVPTDQPYMISGVIPSPTGEWIGLPFQSMHGHKLQLYNPISGKMLDVAKANFSVGDVSGLLNQHFAWSPDGKFLIFAVSQPVENSDIGNGVYIYSIDDQKVSVLLKNLSNEARLAWSPDSKFIVIRKRNCPTQERCDYSLTVLDITSGIEIKTLKVSTLLPFLNFGQSSFEGVDTLCDLDWSPDGRYISFVPLCSYQPTPDPKELYVWDTLENEMFPVAHFTEVHEFQSPYAIYKKIWINANTLLVGVAWTDNPMSELRTKTVAIELPSKTDIELSPFDVEAWAVNPVSGDIAYRLVTEVDSTYMDAKAATLNVGTLTIVDNQVTALTSKISIPTNACRLSWSPDGSILAYTEQQEYGTVGQTCIASPLNVSFLDPATGNVSVYRLESNISPDRAIIVGWVPTN